MSLLRNAISVPVCVEGIENEATYETVLSLGCAIGQGWYFGKPMRADQVRELLAGRERGGQTLPNIVNG